MDSDKRKLIIINSHPIQYFVPLYRYLAQNTKMDVLVLYCSLHSSDNFYDKEFGSEIDWGIDLLSGYGFLELKNYSPLASGIGGFWSLINPGVYKQLKMLKPDAILIHGWNYLTNVFSIIVARLLQIKVIVRGDNPFDQEYIKPRWKRLIKKILYGKILFRFVDIFLFVGKKNYDYYRYYGVSDNKLIYSPHCVDNKFFNSEYSNLVDKKTGLKKKLGLPTNKLIILFVGKLIEKKRPFDLINSFKNIRSENKCLVFVGEGKLKEELINLSINFGLKDVYFEGFKKQSEISEYYSVADILVLPSGEGETWGLVVNEAMNFGLPVIVSDLVGCSGDLVIDNENGFIYKSSDTDDLTRCISKLVESESLRNEFGNKSLGIIRKYSHENFFKSIQKSLELNL